MFKQINAAGIFHHFAVQLQKVAAVAPIAYPLAVFSLKTLNCQKQTDIKLTGVADQVVYHFSEDTFNVTVLGSRDELDALTKDDVLLVADVSGIRKGESAEVTLAVSIRGSELSTSVSPETVTVKAE